MPRNELSAGTVKFLRRLSLAIGALCILAAILANIAGLSISSGISRNQILFIAAGAILITAGITGRKFTSIYRGAGLLLLNILVALLLVELLSLAVVKVIDRDRFITQRMKMEATDGMLDVISRNTVVGQYAPFVVWRSNPDLRCESTSISEDGYRINPGITGYEEAYVVFLFGGSAMWGATVSDEETISFYVQQELREITGRTVDVYNFGQTAFASTQELVELVLQLRNGSVPDFVLFYDGFNDVWGAYSNGFAGGHHSQLQVASRVDGTSDDFRQEPVLEVLLKKSNLWLLVTSIRDMGEEEFNVDELITYRTMGVDRDSLAKDLVEVYLNNCDVVKQLGETYGFESLFVWQPAIWLGDKPFTDFEREIHRGGFQAFQGGGDPAFKDLLNSTYGVYLDSIPSRPDFYSIHTIFDTVGAEMYSDYSGAHVNASANRIIAEELAELILESDPSLTPETDSLETGAMND